jgi:hypothetical protein
VVQYSTAELHSSFLSAFVCPMSMPSPPPNIVALPQTKSTEGKKTPSSSRIPDEGDHPIPSVMRNLYIQPYWYGWVRVLKVTQTVPLSDEHPDPALERPREGGVKSDRIKVEWKERWVLVHGGVVTIRRSQTVRNSSFIQSQTNPPLFIFSRLQIQPVSLSRLYWLSMVQNTSPKYLTRKNLQVNCTPPHLP